jgi:hypothetical protein
MRHVSPDPQAMPQPPQFVTLVVTSTHAEAQFVVPIGHSRAHAPNAHTSSEGQAAPQLPQ